MKEKEQKNLLEVVYKKKDNLKYNVSEEGLVTVVEVQDHKIQKIFRKLRFNIPQERKIDLDEFASFVFLQIDGEKTVEEIGQVVKEKYGEKAEPLYERLTVFLSYLENSFKYIQRVY